MSASKRIRGELRQRLLQAARERYAYESDDDIEVDDNAHMHHNGEQGYWVQAWCYVPQDEVIDESTAE
jgi:hypothetical protein